MDEPLNSPSELLCCRGCLSTVNLCGIHDRRLAETFKRVTGNPVLPQDGLPQHLCGTCCSLLAKGAAFRERCRRAQHCLLTRSQHELTMDYIKTIDRLSHGLVLSLALTQVQIIDLGNSTQNEIKCEPSVSDSKSAIYEPENETIDTFSSGVKDEVNHLDVDDISEPCTDFSGYVTVEVERIIDTKVKVDNAVKPTVKVEVKKLIKNKECKVRKTIVKQNKKLKELQKIPDITYRRLKSDNLLKSLRDDTSVNNELATDFGECGTDEDMQTIDDIAEVKKKVKKELKPRKNILKLIKEFKEFKKERKQNRKIAEQNKKKKKLREIPQIGSGCPTTDHLLTSLKDAKPIFDFAKFENAFNVDITVLNREQQLVDWEQCCKLKKEPAAFRCEECGKGFRQQSTFKNHLLRHDPSAGAHACTVCHARFALKAKRRKHECRHALQFKCRGCGFVSRQRSEARAHFKTHNGFKFQCKHCDKSFVNSSSFFFHLRVAHAAQTVACGECGEPFVSRRGLVMHQARAHKVQKAKTKCACAECGAHFDSASALDTHMRAAGDEGCDTTVRPCAVCGESLPTEDDLKRHIEQLHTKQFKCTECPQTFSRAAWRDIHARKTHGPRPPQPAPAAKSTLCEVCGRQCKTPVGLKMHRRTHTGEKPFPCADCDQWFVSKANVKRHRKLIHLGHRPQVKCEECGKMVFAASLYVHVRGVHRKIRQIRRKRDSSTDK